MQEGAGLDVVSDGELRRHTFIDQLTEAVEGLTPDSGDTGHIPVPFHGEAGALKSVFTIPLSITSKLGRLLPPAAARVVDAVRLRLSGTGQRDQRGRPGEQAAPGGRGRGPCLAGGQLTAPGPAGHAG
jgi:hypothetical protein